MDYQEIKKLMDDMGNSKLESFEIEFPDGVKISMTKQSEKNISVVTAQQMIPRTVELPSVVEEKETSLCQTTQTKQEETSENAKIITSPMVGTFYASSSPDKPAFVQVGDKIKKGQVVCIVEAMKLMNEIESEYDGEIVEICVKDEDVVEYGMPLFKLK